MGIYVGIDLGTTISVAAYIGPGGKPRIIPNKEGERLTPSAVFFDGNKVLVGTEAKKQKFLDEQNYVSFAKRDMGNRQVQYEINNDQYSPEEISAFVLKKIKQDIEQKTGEEILGAVITVPAYFTDAQRVATEQAAAIAGIKVLSLINEPTAAALAYGITKCGAKTQHILVYDLGGGTFDVSIMRIANENIEILSTMGAPKLGGYDFDKAIVDWFKGEAGKQGVRIDEDPKAKKQIYIEAERVKKELSSAEVSEMKMTVSGKEVRASLSRTDFENWIEPLIFTTTALIQGAMDEANLDYSVLDKILLIGGSTRIPLVGQMIEEETELTPVMEINPDEAVAVGAAYHAVNVVKNTAAQAAAKAMPKATGQNTANSGSVSGNAAGPQSAGQTPAVITKKPRSNYAEPVVIDTGVLPPTGKQYTFQDRTSHGIGVVANDPKTREKINVVLVKKNTPVPSRERMDFITNSENQTELQLQITQGEDRDLKYTTIIGTSCLKLKPRPKGSPIRIIIGCDKDFVTRIQVLDMVDKTNLGEMIIDRTANLTDSQVKETKKKIGKLDIG